MWIRDVGVRARIEFFAFGGAMFSLIFCAFCAQKFWKVRTFSGNSPIFLRLKSKADFVIKIK